MAPTLLFLTGRLSREILSHSLRIRGHGEHYFSDFLGPGSPVPWKNHRGISAYRRSLAREGRAGDRKQERHARRLPRFQVKSLYFPNSEAATKNIQLVSGLALAIPSMAFLLSSRTVWSRK